MNKLLSRIRASITNLTPGLESFSDESVQPGVEDCAQLQKNLHELLELLGAYKYARQDHEVSPSFNLHAHISETTEKIKAEAIPSAVEHPPREADPEKPTTKEKTPEQPTSKNGNGRNAKTLFIGINDKFRFINELFAHNDAEYNIAVEQLSNLQTWSETEIYLLSLKNLYGWRENHDAVKYFYSIVKRRFN